MTTVAGGARTEAGPVAPPPDVLPETVLAPAVLVVGAGPAGRAAATAAGNAGADVLLLDEGGGDAPGTLLRTAGVRTLRATAWGAFPGTDGPEVTALAPDARLLIRPRRLILATGSHEAPVHLPGWTLPGCMSAGAMRDLLRVSGVGPGRRVVVAGNGPLNFWLAAALLRGGVQVAAVVEAARRPPATAGLAMAAASPAMALAGLRVLAALRRAGVPVLWDTRPVAAEGSGRFEALCVAGPAGERRIAADACALHWGVQPEAGLARALGARHRVVDGRLETVTDEAGRTSLHAVFAVADGAGWDGARTARHGGTLAGLAAARSLGFAVPAGPRRAMLRAERFGHTLGQAFAAVPPDPAALPDDAVLCGCEGVTAGTVRAAQSAGAASLAAVKRATRAGMGHCAGRLCGGAIARLCGAGAEAGFAAPRLPVRPVLAGAVMADHPEPQDAAVPLPPPTRWTTAAPAALPADAEVLVIGGGIIGLACALFLAREGVDVVLADRGEPGLAASTANAGSLHVQLVPYVYAAGGGPMAETLPLGPASIALWREIARDANESLGLRTEGGLILAETAAELDLLRSKAAFERSRGVPTEVVGAADLARIAPELDGRFEGAAFCPMEGQGDPLRGTAALLALARRAGVRVAGGLDITGLAADAPGWRVETSAGPMRAGQVVNAAGAQARRVGALAGVEIPVHALVQQVIATEAAPPMLRQLVAWTGRHLSLKQGDGGHLLIGGGWPGRVDADGAAQVLRPSLEGNLALAGRALPRLRGVRVVRAWAGLAPTLARAPVISATPGMPGLWHAVTGNGYTLGPVAGRMMADAVRGRTRLPEAFSL